MLSYRRFTNTRLQQDTGIQLFNELFVYKIKKLSLNLRRSNLAFHLKRFEESNIYNLFWFL